MLSTRKTTSVSGDEVTPPPSAINVDTSESIARKTMNQAHSHDEQKPKNLNAGVELFRGGVEAALFSRNIPSKRILTQQLQVSAKALDKARKETYQKKFRLWSKYTTLNLLQSSSTRRLELSPSFLFLPNIRGTPFDCFPLDAPLHAPHAFKALMIFFCA